MCSSDLPSRAALLTGLMPARNGAEANHSKPRAEIRKLPAYLKDLGYEVVSFGKVSHYQHTGDYGFDHFAHDKFHEDIAVSAAIAWLRARRDSRPLCLFVGTNWPHVPWPATGEGYAADAVTVPANHVDTPRTREARATYYAAVGRMDRELGEVFDAAREVLGAGTFFLTTSDHGAQWPFGKWSCYDGGIRTPMIAVWPGRTRPGTRTEYHPASAHWVIAELVEAAGGRPYVDLVHEHVVAPAGAAALLGAAAVASRQPSTVRSIGSFPADRTDLVAVYGREDLLPEAVISHEAVLGMNDPRSWEVAIPGGGGITTAHDLALVYQHLLMNRQIGRAHV